MRKTDRRWRWLPNQRIVRRERHQSRRYRDSSTRTGNRPGRMGAPRHLRTAARRWTRIVRSRRASSDLEPARPPRGMARRPIRSDLVLLPQAAFCHRAIRRDAHGSVHLQPTTSASPGGPPPLPWLTSLTSPWLTSLTDPRYSAALHEIIGRLMPCISSEPLRIPRDMPASTKNLTDPDNCWCSEIQRSRAGDCGCSSGSSRYL